MSIYVDMDLEKIKKQKFKNRNDLENLLIEKWNLPKVTLKEKEKWNYKTMLNISPQFLVGKNVLCNSKEYIIKSVVFNNFGKIEIRSFSEEILFLTNCYLKINNPITNTNSLIQLHPGRKGKILWERGYYLEEKLFKSLYYETEEYRIKFQNGFEKKYGYKANAPIQVQAIKEKISNTLKSKYNVNWFLNRGDHYYIIDKIMIDKYGVSNLFNDIEWQHLNASKNNRSGISNIEKKFCDEITNFLNLKDDDFMCQNSKIGRKIFKFDKKYYAVDYYIPKYNMIIEFYGDYWHCNPEKYNRDYIHAYKKMTAEDIWNKDKKRLQEIINKYNCHILIVWEKNWRQNQSEQLNLIQTFYENIKNKIN